MANNFHVVSIDGVKEVIPFTEQEEIEKAANDLIFEWKMVRETRNKLLEESDLWVMVDRWVKYSSELQTEISNYRQLLRDLPENTPDPFNVEWPSKPII